MKTQSTPPLAAVDQPRLVRLLLGSKDEWDFAPFGDFWVMTVSPVTAPNIIRRMMQRIIMGSRYRLIEDRPLTPIIISEPNNEPGSGYPETEN
jgi:hypothetical protein